jgi:HD superfamily phosphohydrolase
MKIQRIRDPVHGLIVFDDDGLVDEQVWALLNTPDVQRLRRIKQLGVSEFVFPSASHARFSHSVGVFHNARRLVSIIKREIGLKRVDGDFNRDRAKTALFAALLHDIGHGPFSHAFEEARIPTDRIQTALAEMQQRSATVLELAATIHWLAVMEGIPDWKTELFRRKGAKTNNDRDQRAVELLRTLGLPPAVGSAGQV